MIYHVYFKLVYEQLIFLFMSHILTCGISVTHFHVWKDISYLVDGFNSYDHTY